MKANYVEDCGIIFEPETPLEEFALRKLKEQIFEANITERIIGLDNKSMFILNVAEENKEDENPYLLDNTEAQKAVELERRQR
jgi:hypothetical protein